MVAARELDAAAIIVLSTTGRTARAVAKYRPACPIIAATFDERVANSLMLHRGVIPLILPASAAQDPDFALVLAVLEVERMGLRMPSERLRKLLVAVKVGQRSGTGAFAGAMNSVNDSSPSSVSSLCEPGPTTSTAPYLTVL